MADQVGGSDMSSSTPKPVWERCWCWQYGRCLVDCPTADLPKPLPFTSEAAWRDAALTAMRAVR